MAITTSPPTVFGNTVDVLRFLNESAERALAHGVKVREQTSAVDSILTELACALKDAKPGIRVLILSAFTHDHPIQEAGPELAIRFVGGDTDSSRFSSMDRARNEADRLASRPGFQLPVSPWDPAECKHSVLAACVLDASPEARGQLSHPSVLSDVLDEIAYAVRPWPNTRQALQVLDGLARGAQLASEQCASHACVAIRPKTGTSNADLEVVPFCARDDSELRDRISEFRGSATVAHLPVRHQDVPD